MATATPVSQLLRKSTLLTPVYGYLRRAASHSVSTSVCPKEFVKVPNTSIYPYSTEKGCIFACWMSGKGYSSIDQVPHKQQVTFDDYRRDTKLAVALASWAKCQIGWEKKWQACTERMGRDELTLDLDPVPTLPKTIQELARLLSDGDAIMVSDTNSEMWHRSLIVGCNLANQTLLLVNPNQYQLPNTKQGYDHEVPFDRFIERLKQSQDYFTTLDKERKLPHLWWVRQSSDALVTP